MSVMLRTLGKLVSACQSPRGRNRGVFVIFLKVVESWDKLAVMIRVWEHTTGRIECVSEIVGRAQWFKIALVGGGATLRMACCGLARADCADAVGARDIDTESE